jgi:hypothetical protein
MLIYELQVLDTKTITLYNVIVYKNCWGIKKMETVVLKVEGLDCPSCAKTVEKGLKKLKGIEKQNPTFCREIDCNL